MQNMEGAFLSRDGKRQVLIVDDEFINREVLGAMLEDEYELLFAESGEKAMEIISSARQTLSLVMLDLLLPGISGMEVLKWMRADVETQRIPVIVMRDVAGGAGNRNGNQRRVTRQNRHIALGGAHIERADSPLEGIPVRRGNFQLEGAYVFGNIQFAHFTCAILIDYDIN